MDWPPRNERRAPGAPARSPLVERRRTIGPSPSALWIADGLRPRAPAGPTPTPPPTVHAVSARAPEPDTRALPLDRQPWAWLAALALSAALIALAVSRSLVGHPPLLIESWRGLLPLGQAAAASLAPAVPFPELRPGLALPGAPIGGRAADADVRRLGHASIHGGVLFVTDTFASVDGAYDLLLHFHGNTAVVRESAEHAKVNAIVAVVNLGIGSAPYEEAYAAPGTYEALLDEIQRAVAERGVSRPHLRRVALSSWSAGYGAISTILQVRRGTDPLDALLVLDGIHCGWLEENPSALNPRQLAPFVGAARAAAAGQILFSITHSDIDPPTYASARDAATYLLQAVGGSRQPAGPEKAPPHVELDAARGAVSRRLEKWMEPLSEGAVGGLHVRGFKGNTPEHHMAHLLQMAATVMPELASRWQ